MVKTVWIIIKSINDIEMAIDYSSIFCIEEGASGGYTTINFAAGGKMFNVWTKESLKEILARLPQ